MDRIWTIFYYIFRGIIGHKTGLISLSSTFSSHSPVRTSLDGGTEWDKCLRVTGVHLPTGYHFGLSASTGRRLTDAHDVISFAAIDIPSADDEGKVCVSALFFTDFCCC